MKIPTPLSSTRSIPVTDFADPCTRTLLANNGTTTLLLEAALRTSVTVVVQDQYLQSAGELPPEIGRALQLQGQHRVLVRHSILMTPDQRPVSCNRAIIATALDSPLSALGDDRYTPLGRTLLSAGVEQHRQVLTTGHHPWPLTAEFRAAAGKTYLVGIDGRPRLHLTETYNPDLFSADLDPVN
ncbi:hypothetical protein [Nocardia sp. XZ_19_369]|uniref:chorismate--pyruvate lyase family protein n=1 Tax=Nocardia sp. XZ_19_369 TaxID=2769487 RepID=UPI00188ED8D7|nr:hypothetical protein [Nocardia sp. XZ_19_369]